MRIQKNRAYAIITGDIISSSRLSLSDRRELQKNMVRSSNSIRKAFKEIIPIDVGFFRGDGWQIVIQEPERSLRIALYYRSALRAKMGSHKLNTRMSIAVGKIDFIPSNRVSEGNGEAFQLSGRALEEMQKHETIRFQYPGLPDEEALNVVAQLVDTLSSRWSDKQALAVTGALQGWTQEMIARKAWEEAISQQAIAQHLDRAAWPTIERSLDYFEKTIRSALKI